MTGWRVVEILAWVAIAAVTLWRLAGDAQLADDAEQASDDADKALRATDDLRERIVTLEAARRPVPYPRNEPPTEPLAKAWDDSLADLAQSSGKHRAKTKP